MTDLPIRPEVRISVTDFGPIANGEVDLRPLTVFVGPSNTGKTYFSILIYALHRILRGFPRFPVLYDDSRGFTFPKPLGVGEWKSADAESMERAFNEIVDKLRVPSRTFRLSDLPKSVVKAAQADLRNPSILGQSLTNELERCFDLASVSDLVRLPPPSNGMKVSLDVSEEDQSLWDFHLELSKSDTIIGGRIKDMVIFPAEGTDYPESDRSRQMRWLDSFIAFLDGSLPSPGTERFSLFREFLRNMLLNIDRRTDHDASLLRTHYLPAARSGIMQSHRVIASSLVARSTRAGMELFPELPTFSGVMADFMQRLILHEDGRGDHGLFTNLAESIESEMLGGKIRAKSFSPGGYPEFLYQPLDAKQDIRLTRASSMVTEVAPVVLFLRSAVGRGDLLIIEEPEAHLHPAAQTQMAVTLAHMVRAGIRVVVTTHSDWLLKEIGNLMRDGELRERTSESGTGSLATSLRPSDVGIWLFRKGEKSEGSTVEEIPFDRIEGVEPEDYDSVAEELYNRSADLQNRFEEACCGKGTGV